MQEIRELDESIRMLAQGLTTMLAIQAQQNTMLKEILAACTKADGPSLLVEAILKLDQSIQNQTAILTRIEAKVSE